jgi:hypothetical protein
MRLLRRAKEEALIIGEVTLQRRGKPRVQYS